MKLFSLSAIVLAAVCVSAAPAYAQRTNNSNTTGVGSYSPQLMYTKPGFTSTTVGYNSTTLTQAQSLMQSLSAAQSAVDGFKPSAVSTGTRSYVRVAVEGASNNNLDYSGRAQLDANLLKAQSDAAAFLESVKNPSTEMLEAADTTSTSVGPTW